MNTLQARVFLPAEKRLDKGVGTEDLQLKSHRLDFAGTTARFSHINNRHGAMGTFPHKTTTKDSSSLTMGDCEEETQVASYSNTTEKITDVVDSGQTPISGDPFSLTMPDTSDNRCQYKRLVCPLLRPGSAGKMDGMGGNQPHKLARTQSSKAGTCLSSLIGQQHVLVKTDNVTAKAHINQQGGTKAVTLFREVV